MFDRLLEGVVVIGPTAFAIGVEVVSEKVRKARIWKVSVVAFGIILTALTYWQIGRQEARASENQAALQKENTQAADRFSHALADVRNSNDAILGFVSKPPEGVTAKQLAQYVRAYEQNRKSPASNSLAGISTEGLISTAKTAVDQLRELTHSWEAEDANEDNVAFETRYTPQLGPSKIAAITERTKANKVAIGKKYRSQAKDAITFASDLRTEILRRFPVLKGQNDTAVTDGLFSKLISGTYEEDDLDMTVRDFEGLLNQASVIRK